MSFRVTFEIPLPHFMRSSNGYVERHLRPAPPGHLFHLAPYQPSHLFALFPVTLPSQGLRDPPIHLLPALALTPNSRAPFQKRLYLFHAQFAIFHADDHSQACPTTSGPSCIRQDSVR